MDAIFTSLGMHRPVVCVVGPPGAGKTHFALNLATLLRGEARQTSAILRELSNQWSNSEMATHIKKSLKRNNQVDRKDACDFVIDIAFGDPYRTTVLDGFPRTATAAESLNEFCEINERKLLVFHIHAPANICWNRYSQKSGIKKKNRVAFDLRSQHYSEVERQVISNFDSEIVVDIFNQ